MLEQEEVRELQPDAAQYLAPVELENAAVE